MRAIYKKELRTYLTSMTGYIFMAVLLAVASLYFVANCLIGGYPVFGVVLSSVYFVLLIVVPVLTMRSIAEEKRQKTDQLLLTAPVSIWKIVAGKYLAMFTVFLIPMAILCLYPLILLQFGSVSLPMAYTAILGYMLFGGCCLAIGLFLSAVTESQVIAAVLTFGALFFLNMSTGIANLIGAEGVLGQILSAICIYQPFINFVQGIFDLTGVLYYLSVIALFLFLTIQLLYKKHGTYRASMSVFACVAAVLVNLIAVNLPSQYVKFDVSEQQLFTIGDQTAEILENLDEDITLYLIAQQGGEDSTLLELLERYEGLSGHITVETVVLLSHKKPDSTISVKVEFGEGEGKVPLDNISKRAEAYKPKERVTYKMIKEYIEAKYGFKVHTAYIAEVKRSLGLPMYDAPNAVEELKQPRKHPTAEKAEAIKDALKHFEVI